MKRMMLFFAVAFLLGAQSVSQKTWTALTATGTTSSFSIAANSNHTLSIVVSGGPSGCTVNLDGSLDSTHWFDLSGGQTCTSSVMFHVANRPVTFVRANLTALSGGTAPTVTVVYVGAVK